MGTEADQEVEMTDAEHLYELWRCYEEAIGGRKRRKEMGVGARRCIEKGLKYNTVPALEMYLEYIYKSSDTWPCCLRVSRKYTQLETLFRAQNAGKNGKRVKLAIWRHIQKNGIPDYTFKEVEWFEYKGMMGYVDLEGNDKYVMGGKDEVERWMSWSKKMGLLNKK